VTRLFEVDKVQRDRERGSEGERRACGWRVVEIRVMVVVGVSGVASNKG